MTPTSPAEAEKTAVGPEKKERGWPRSDATEQTVSLPLKGGKDGITKGLDNRTVIKAPEDPRVVKAAHDYALSLERIEKVKDEANECAQKLLDLFLSSKKARKVKVITDTKTYYFSTATLTKIVTEKKKSVN